MPPVTVRYFAAAREAAGTAEERVDADDAAALLALLAARHGDRLARVLAVSTVLVDGERRREGPLGEAAAVEVLPPFAGG